MWIISKYKNKLKIANNFIAKLNKLLFKGDSFIKFNAIEEFLNYYIDLNYRYDVLYLNDKEKYKDLFEYA